MITGVSKQSVYNNVLTDLFDLVGPRNYSYNRNTGQLKLCGSEWLVIGAKDEGSERYIRGLTVGVAICDDVSLMPQSFFQMLLSRMSPEGRAAVRHDQPRQSVPLARGRIPRQSRAESEENSVVRPFHHGRQPEARC